MQTTVQFLDALSAKHGKASDYRLAKIMGCTPASISHYRHGRSYLNDETSLKVAALLDLEPGYVLACVYAERAARANAPEVQEAWERIALRVAAAVMMGVGVGGLAACLIAPDSGLPAAILNAYLHVATTPVLIEPDDCVLCKMLVRANLIDFAPVFALLAALGAVLAHLAYRLRRRP